MPRRAAYVTLPLLLLLAGCGESAEASEARDKIRDAIDALGAYTQTELADLTVRLQDGFGGLEAEARQLLAEAEVRGGEAKERLCALARDLEQKAETARQRLGAAGDAGADDARRALANAQESLADAKAALEKAWAELRGGK